MGPQAHILPDGARLHLNHGPIDLIIGVDGDRTAAFRAAQARFVTILDELVPDLALLRQAVAVNAPMPKGPVSRRMILAALPHADTFVTPMAAVAGAVAQEVLTAMMANADMTRAYVNNGGDIALHLTPGTEFSLAMQTHVQDRLGRLTINHSHRVRGIATSGRHGRSLSMGIADSVTVLARSAAQADVAATLIANAVDLPDHPAIQRKPARDVDDASDLQDRSVVVSCGALPASDIEIALRHGLSKARDLQSRGLIAEAALFLQGASVATSVAPFQLTAHEAAYA